MVVEVGNGVMALRLDGVLEEAVTHSRVEHRLVKDLREKICPAEYKKETMRPESPLMFDAVKLMAREPVQLTLIGAETQILLKVMRKRLKEVGVTQQDGEWFYTLLDALEEEEKDEKVGKG